MSKCEVALRCGAVQSGRSEVNRDDQVRPGCICVAVRFSLSCVYRGVVIQGWLGVLTNEGLNRQVVRMFLLAGDQ